MRIFWLKNSFHQFFMMACEWVHLISSFQYWNFGKGDFKTELRTFAGLILMKEIGAPKRSRRIDAWMLFWICVEEVKHLKDWKFKYCTLGSMIVIMKNVRQNFESEWGFIDSKNEAFKFPRDLITGPCVRERSHMILDDGNDYTILSATARGRARHRIYVHLVSLHAPYVFLLIDLLIDLLISNSLFQDLRWHEWLVTLLSNDRLYLLPKCSYHPEIVQDSCVIGCKPGQKIYPTVQANAGRWASYGVLPWLEWQQMTVEPERCCHYGTFGVHIAEI